MKKTYEIVVNGEVLLEINYPEGHNVQILSKVKEAPKKVIGVGRFYIEYAGSHAYLLTQVGPRSVCLIGLGTANRYREPVEVQDMNNITQKEWIDIAGDYFKEVNVSWHVGDFVKE